jgi:hypothetical protein
MSKFSKQRNFQIPGGMEKHDFLVHVKAGLDYFSSCIIQGRKKDRDTCDTEHLRKESNSLLSVSLRISSDSTMGMMLRRPYLNPLQAALNRPEDFDKIARVLTRMLSYVRGSPTDGKGEFSHEHDLVGAFLERDDKGGQLISPDSNPSYRWLASSQTQRDIRLITRP